MNNDELLEQFGKLINPLKDGQERIEKTQHEQGKSIHEQGTVIAQMKTDLQTVKRVVTHISTGLEALAAGQQDIRAKMATQADVQDIKTDLVKQQRRIENVEENTKTPNPHKN